MYFVFIDTHIHIAILQVYSCVYICMTNCELFLLIGPVIVLGRHQTEPTNDPVILNACMYICRIMHDSVK